MRRFLVVLIALAVVFLTTGSVSAQQAVQPAPPGGHPPAPQAGGHGMHQGGMHGAGMQHGGGMPMMCHMMGGGMPMMGMMSGGQMDPKTMAQMLQLRGDLMKAMGDVLIKHGKAMEAVKP